MSHQAPTGLNDPLRFQIHTSSSGFAMSPEARNFVHQQSQNSDQPGHTRYHGTYSVALAGTAACESTWLRIFTMCRAADSTA